jgi:ribonuclease P/MRP protein subunit RPP40
MFGISNKVLHLLQSYLFNRQQFVSYNGFSSFLYHSTSGIPQGSNLGPLLFICFINDLPSALTCGSLLYADDNKMYSTINNLADALTLQENLNRLSSWCILNKLALNVSKCKVVSYSYKKSPLLFNYHIDNLILKRENTIKDLGIYFDERLNFNYHIDIAVNKALSMLGFIIRNSRDTNIEIFQLLFKTYVIPCLEYACLVWNPFYQCHVTSIEAVQRKFLIYLHFKVFGVFPVVGTHNHILREQFNFLSLANRRKIITLLFLHKLIHYRIDCADLLQ